MSPTRETNDPSDTVAHLPSQFEGLITRASGRTYPTSRRLTSSNYLDNTTDSPDPPPFSSLYFPVLPSREHQSKPLDQSVTSEVLPAFTAVAPLLPEPSSSTTAHVAETKSALPRDTKEKEGSSSRDLDDGEPPPPYSEGSSPLDSFTYVMATAGGPASIITQVSQGGGPPINTLGCE